jgi:hypothetical protein
MHNAPPTVDFAEAHGQSRLQLFSLAVGVDAGAPPYRSSERYVLPGSDLQVVKVIGD